MTAQPMWEPMQEPGGNVVGNGPGDGPWLIKFSHARVVFFSSQCMLRRPRTHIAVP